MQEGVAAGGGDVAKAATSGGVDGAIGQGAAGAATVLRRGRRAWRVRVRRIACVATPVVAIGALPACTHSAPPATASPAAVVAAAWQKTEAAGVATSLSRLQLHGLVVRGAPAGVPNLITGPNEDLGGDGTFDLKLNDGSFTLDTPNFGTIEVDVTSGSYYLHFPALVLNPVFTAKPWLYIDAQTMGKLHSPSFVALAQLFAAVDPAYSLNFLAGFSGGAKVQGTSTVKGAACTEYAYTIDLTRAASRLTGTERNLVLQAESVLHTHLQPIVTCIDAQGRARRSVFTINLNHVAFPVPGQPLASETLTGSITVTDELDAFTPGTQSTKPPPASEVTDLSGILRQIGT